jgi:hypothetical protein
MRIMSGIDENDIDGDQDVDVEGHESPRSAGTTSESA